MEGVNNPFPRSAEAGYLARPSWYYIWVPSTPHTHIDDNPQNRHFQMATDGLSKIEDTIIQLADSYRITGNMYSTFVGFMELADNVSRNRQMATDGTIDEVWDNIWLRAAAWEGR
jgi:hypothetical protein